MLLLDSRRIVLLDGRANAFDDGERDGGALRITDEEDGERRSAGDDAQEARSASRSSPLPWVPAPPCGSTEYVDVAEMLERWCWSVGGTRSNWLEWLLRIWVSGTDRGDQRRALRVFRGGSARCLSACTDASFASSRSFASSSAGRLAYDSSHGMAARRRCWPAGCELLLPEGVRTKWLKRRKTCNLHKPFERMVDVRPSFTSCGVPAPSVVSEGSVNKAYEEHTLREILSRCPRQRVA